MKNAKGEDTTASFSWWQDSHSRPPQSPWLQATLSDLDEKTKVMVSIIDQNDGDSFSRRAETFYMRRPELVGTIRNVHRSYGSLARRYKQLASPVLNLEDDSSSSSFFSSSSSSSAAAIENGRRRLGYDEIKAVSEEKKVEVEIADTRLRVLKLAEGNLYEQAELTRKNNHDREAIRLFCTRVQRLVNEEHRDPNSFLRTPSSTSPP
ncbi:protein NETWORKED 3A-like isoform X1 [Neltuma alba]|uniref:protein NETWORKED 3A-like isoform X1 n=1 Tax=Neltuma alba TaxID=207710 RepID=UPI0010A57E5E|nr:protein NETWORKED 3A-like isoform X1 [Prosopis alba]